MANHTRHNRKDIARIGNNINQIAAVANSESIKVMQKRLKDTEEEIRLQEEMLLQNERDQRLLSEYQKKIDTYLGVKKDEI